MTYTQKSICPYDCPTSCGFLAETDGERILSVKGDREHPVTRGLLCRKMQQYEQSVHSPRRILTPLKRRGRKGEGKFIPVSWDEAVQEITDRWKEILKEDGGDAVLPMYYSGVMSIIQRRSGDALFNRMGACTLEMTLCSSAKGAGYKSVMGDTGCLDPRELAESDFYIIWGSNMKATSLPVFATVEEGRRAGKRAVLIEACACDMAAHCDETILVRPGTDGALALAVMHVLLREKLADEEFLRENARGYDEFKATLASCTPQWAQEITGVPSEIIERLAVEYADASAPAVILGSGPSRHGNGGMTTRLIVILSLFTGAWKQPGGGLCGCSTGAGPYVDETLITRPDFRRKPGRVININCLASALKGTDGGRPVKAFYVYGGNPVASVSSQKEMKEGLMRPDLFTVVHERFMTDTAKYADIILPAAFSVEQTDCYNAYGYCTFGTARRIIPPAGQCRSNWDTFCILAQAMGYEEDHFKHTEEEMLELLLAHPTKGLKNIGEKDWELLRAGGVISTPYADHTRIGTPDGKIRIVNEEMEERVPHYTENYGGEYPLRLVCVPDCHTLNSIFLERDSLVSQRGPAALMLHPEDAACRGIADGDRITAFNDLAEVEFTARITELVAPGTAAASGVFSSDITGTDSQVNALHHARLSDIGKATTINDNAVDVRRKEE